MLVYPEIDPVAVSFGPVQIHWYGIMYALAFALGWWILLRRRHRLGLSPEQVGDFAFACILGVILGGRVGYVVFYNPAHYLANPLSVLAIWDGGMAFHGGLIGVAVAVVWFARRNRLAILRLADFITPIVPIGLGLGRLGNFINGELWGRPADPDLPWAMVFPHVDRLPRHPSQLYELLLEGVVLFLLIWGLERRFQSAGRLFGLLLLGYGVARFGLEYFRAPDPQLGLLVMGLSMGQLLSLPMVAVGIWLMVRQAGDRSAATE